MLMQAHMRKDPCVYILVSDRNGMLYIGVTSDLEGRMSIHIQNLLPGALPHVLCDVSFDGSCDRTRIEQVNPEWADLFDRTTGAVSPLPTDVERRIF
jgi:hypothetical protein